MSQRKDMIKIAGRVWAVTMLLATGAGGAFGQEHNHDGSQASPPGTVQPRTASPKGAEVYFHYPTDGIRVSQRFTAQFGMRGMGIAPAGVVKPGTGHHHLLIDVDEIDEGRPIPSDYNHIHLGNGQTEVVLALPPGRHTLQLLAGDHLHIPHEPPVMSRKITIYVR
jgi:Domain of unknown function (DUF4399)